MRLSQPSSSIPEWRGPTRSCQVPRRAAEIPWTAHTVAKTGTTSASAQSVLVEPTMPSSRTKLLLSRLQPYTDPRQMWVASAGGTSHQRWKVAGAAMRSLLRKLALPLEVAAGGIGGVVVLMVCKCCKGSKRTIG